MSRINVREKLLDAALETIQRYGFNGCGVQDITQAAGVPKGSFYNHFESKEALGAAVIGRYWEQRACSALDILNDAKLRPVERLRRYIAAIAEKMAARQYASGCLVGNLSAELSDQSTLIAERLSGVLDGWTRAMEACVREGQAAGELRCDLDPALTARFLVNSLQGAILRARVDKSGTALADLDAIVCATLLS
jgi:TetR/AcrR family transcriptional regulator, transcriptional repressor for nem operon